MSGACSQKIYITEIQDIAISNCVSLGEIVSISDVMTPVGQRLVALILGNQKRHDVGFQITKIATDLTPDFADTEGWGWYNFGFSRKRRLAFR